MARDSRVHNDNAIAAVEHLCADDPVVAHADWEGISAGGNLCTHKLVCEGLTRLVFKPAVSVLAIYLLPVLVRGAVLLAWLFDWIRDTPWWVPWCALLFGIVWVGVGFDHRIAGSGV